MIFISNNLFKKFLSNEILRFLLIGSSTVLLDLICYYILIQFDILTSISKGLSFSIGAIYAYIANKSFTFKHKHYRLSQFFLFLLLYLSTLLVNVIVNEILLNFFSRTSASLIFAFFSATFASASLNFLGMKYIVFRSKDK